MIDTCLIIWVIVGSQRIDNGPAYPVYIVQDTDYQSYMSYDPKFKDHPKTLGAMKFDPQ